MRPLQPHEYKRGDDVNVDVMPDGATIHLAETEDESQKRQENRDTMSTLACIDSLLHVPSLPASIPGYDMCVRDRQNGVRAAMRNSKAESRATVSDSYRFDAAVGPQAATLA